jgi:hypothetical protein
MLATRLILRLATAPACGGSKRMAEDSTLPFVNRADESEIAVGGTGPDGVFVPRVSDASFLDRPASEILRTWAEMTVMFMWVCSETLRSILKTSWPAEPIHEAFPKDRERSLTRNKEGPLGRNPGS